MTHFLTHLASKSINWQTAVSFGALLVALCTLRQRRQKRVKNKLGLLDPRLEVHTKRLLFRQALYDSPEFVRSCSRTR